MQTKTEDPRKAFPVPPFPEQTQDSPGLESLMNPLPDYGKDSYKGSGRLQGRVALVTGGDSGIGRAVCLAFAREGADVAISYLNEHSDAEEIKKVIEADGRKVLLLPGDISDDEHCKKIVEQTYSTFGKLDILVNNAAFQGKAVKKFEDLTHDRVVKTFKTNIISMFSLVHYSLPLMKPGSSIINVGSIQAYDPKSPILDYASTKGAIVAFTKGLAGEVINRGIRANVVAPGPVWTPLVIASFDKEKIKNFGGNYPIGRPAQPIELATPFVFLASNDATYVNGEVLGVTGGEPLS